MRKIKFLLLPSAVTVGVAIVLTVTGILPVRWHPAIYVVGAAAGLIPLALEIVLSLRDGKINLGIPVFTTIIILLFVRQFLIADIFALLIVMGSIFKEYILWRVERSVSEIAHSLPDTAFLKDGDIDEIHITSWLAP